jgi:hypothetical protein
MNCVLSVAVNQNHRSPPLDAILLFSHTPLVSSVGNELKLLHDSVPDESGNVTELEYL